jgi:cell fate (sporulation/competence/biofilm development) regulator YmcA (YheA/YmcA/DUF963 family)
MNKEIASQINLIRSDLMSLPVVKEYFKVVNEIKNNDELQNIIKNRKYYQQIDVQNSSDANNHNEYLRYCKLYNEHPLIHNYEYLKKEVILIIDGIKEIVCL